MSEKLNLREKLHIGEKRTGGEKPRMSKKLKKGIIIAACAVGVCGAVWGGLTIARNAQRSDVKVYSVNDFCISVSDRCTGVRSTRVFNSGRVFRISSSSQFIPSACSVSLFIACGRSHWITMGWIGCAVCCGALFG